MADAGQVGFELGAFQHQMGPCGLREGRGLQRQTMSEKTLNTTSEQYDITQGYVNIMIHFSDFGVYYQISVSAFSPKFFTYCNKKLINI